MLWHSLAYGEQATGLTRAELNATLGHLNIRLDNYDSALEALAGGDMTVACYYLYDEERVRFKSDPNLIRIIDQRVDNTPDAQARSRFESRLETEVGTGGFETVVFPESPADLPDKISKPQLAVMHMDTAPVSDGGENTPEKIQTLYEKSASKHGGQVQSRVYKNYVLFLAPDEERIKSGIGEARQLEAIEALLDDSQQTADLSNEQIEELRERRDQAHGLLGELVRGVYRHLYYVDRDGLTHITINATEANGGTTLVNAVEETLEDRLIRADASAKGTAFFKQKLWQRTQDSMTTQQLVTQFAKKPGLPYLLNTKPLRKTVERMVDSGYVYWDGESETVYWDGDADAHPNNWDEDTPLVESPDVQTSIQDSNVKIGDGYVVYTGIEAFLEVHGDSLEVPETPEPDDDDDETEDELEGDDDDLGGSDDEEVIDGPGTQPREWDHATSLMAASRAFKEVRGEAISSASDGGAGLSQVTVEVGGEDRLSKGSFIAQQGAFKDRADHVSVRMQYETASDSDATYKARFQGGLEEFSRVTNQPDPFGDTVRIDLKFRVNLPEPEPITDDEDDLLAGLEDALGQTNIDVKVQARGPTEIALEAKQ
ncbi:hypothetical protein C495_16765 [Natronorubrum sulfidifaciens JCM 14089]|uniref:Uncharacterized protein n=1 Tax=Natronorubrum sulfidifaciens JCM 14089 TaxID=1230460 RepID=L9VWU2_9EURY|nr:hypothetical protein C495_16765 [Natronorubrum sulfidifaciens JCM 14089]